jgi:uncharacterized protein (DUF4213/DUF364 family)
VIPYVFDEAQACMVMHAKLGLFGDNAVLHSVNALRETSVKDLTDRVACEDEIIESNFFG